MKRHVSGTMDAEFSAVRRTLLGCTVVAAVSLVPARAGTLPQAEVWKSPSCGCCKDWIGHMEGNGFGVRVNDSGNAAVRARLGIAQRFGSCHTAIVEGYAIEGHVPASEIRRLLKDRPKALGLAVPGMPIGTPGMDGPEYGGRRDAFDVLLMRADGTASVYSSYR